MRTNEARSQVPPFGDSLFPHQQLPAYHALQDAIGRLDAALIRSPDCVPHAQRLRIHLHDLSIRLIITARGSASQARWCRRILAASRRCAQAQGLVDALAARALLGRDESRAIAEALERVVESLDEQLLRAKLPDDVYESMSLMVSTQESPPRCDDGA